MTPIFVMTSIFAAHDACTLPYSTMIYYYGLCKYIIYHIVLYYIISYYIVLSDRRSLLTGRGPPARPRPAAASCEGGKAAAPGAGGLY